MLNVKALNELLSQNTDEKLCKKWWLMTPNGTLLAHSDLTEGDKFLRRQIAIVALAWQEHDSATQTPNDGQEPISPTVGGLQDRLRTLTIEADTNNLIATRVQSQLVLVLEGGVPSRRAGFEAKTTAEGPDDQQYPTSEQDLATKSAIQNKNTSATQSSADSSRANSVFSVASNTILRMQRRKLEAMANAIADDFEQTGFKMPNENGSGGFAWDAWDLSSGPVYVTKYLSRGLDCGLKMHAKLGKVLIPEKVSADGLRLLQASLEVDEKKGLDSTELEQMIGEYDALIVRSETKVNAALLEAGKRLRVVARAGVGVDNVDLEAATKLGIIVINSPQGNINAAAEHTIALLMAVARNIGDACASVKSGKWERSRLIGVEVKGKTLSIVGLGKVGLTVARAAGGLGMNLLAYDPYANRSLAAAANVDIVTTMDELIQQADFLTMHTPLIASTKGMIGIDELRKMKPTAHILNVARGGMIDEAALLAALESGTIAGAGLDVFTTEPPEVAGTAAALIAHPKVVATPHLGASTVEAQENVSIDVCSQVLSILSGQLPRSAVNAPIIVPEEYRTLAPFISLLEKMGSLYTQHFSLAGTKQRNVRNGFDVIYEGELASSNTTKPLFAALLKGLISPISTAETLNVNMVNAELIAKERGLLINESQSRDSIDGAGYASSITLCTRSDPRSISASRSRHSASTDTEDHSSSQAITGFVSNNIPYISRLGHFRTSFVPSGILIICRNYDEPGKIGVVGGLLGKAGVNIRSMSVAPIDRDDAGDSEPNGAPTLIGKDETADHATVSSGTEALMILGVDRMPASAVLEQLGAVDGVLSVSVIVL